MRKLLKLAGGILNNSEKNSSFKLSNFIKNKILKMYGIKKNEDLNISYPKENLDTNQASLSSLLPHDSNKM